MSQQADQLILDYLAKIGTEAAPYLTPTKRRHYIDQVRERIDSQLSSERGEHEVRRVLDRLGTPRELVVRECGDTAHDTSNSAAPNGRATAAEGDAAETDEEAMTSPSGRRDIGVLARPVRLRRAPPPWKGGPKRTTFYRRETARSTEDTPGGASAQSPNGTASTSGELPPWEGRKWQLHPGLVFVRLLYAAKHYPLDIVALLVYLISGLISAVSFLWPIAAVQLVLGRLWHTADRWVGVGVPLVATMVAMALWDSSAWEEQYGWEPYPDEYLLHSLLDTGLLGLQIATVACFFYLAWRAARIVRAPNARVDEAS
ncbi:hypothetical protein RIF23_07810 [Lipingzhangella sp. LS1_29]|uniref:Uncharacterized protein n=1 Tax=Lipingzhangella rawalii TaxID=2055835 RepID=A0ABU2H5C6_9ACTN|nr:hypothetical protein [Lipingzhangella rawalii]MDS1270197.1 hypothetical protein [Lipingzhangella rawalii]